jgi:DMSO/TMAO reductase YedYZ molybdopterin-dependent catalytic subunit
VSSSRALPYSQIVPLGKCLEESSLVAYKLNDRFLPLRNGFPARAVLPGWYAMDSVKWLRRMVVLRSEDEATEFHESGMDRYYTRLRHAAGGQRPEGRVAEILVKSVIAYPTEGSKLPADGPVLSRPRIRSGTTVAIILIIELVFPFKGNR